jgi:hypothetical protein
MQGGSSPSNAQDQKRAETLELAIPSVPVFCILMLDCPDAVNGWKLVNPSPKGNKVMEVQLVPHLPLVVFRASRKE